MTPPQSERADSIVLQWGSRSVAARLRLSGRRVLKIEIDPEGVVTVHAPDGTDVGEIARRAAQKGSWIFRELDVIAARPANTPHRRYVSGETHLFLGRQYRLQIEKADEAHVRCEGGRMIVTARDPDDQAHCGKLIKAFYALNPAPYSVIGFWRRRRPSNARASSARASSSENCPNAGAATRPTGG